jgi:hypothetical protein
MRLRSSGFICRSLARIRLRIVVRRTMNRPKLFFPLMCVKPRKSIAWKGTPNRGHPPTSGRNAAVHKLISAAVSAAATPAAVRLKQGSQHWQSIPDKRSVGPVPAPSLVRPAGAEYVPLKGWRRRFNSVLGPLALAGSATRSAIGRAGPHSLKGQRPGQRELSTDVRA